MTFKTFSTMAFFGLAASTANAGGLLDAAEEDTVEQPVVVVEEDGGELPIWIPLAVLVGIGALAGSGGGS